MESLREPLSRLSAGPSTIPRRPTRSPPPTPTNGTDTTDTTEAADSAEVELHPDFVMPVPEPGDARATVAWWCDQIAAQARAAHPDPDQWLQRAC
ncbi:hypothetical protein [Kitasatospora sp. NPDC088346]|uniref:hypothetical protein n=1 Tax=Kitasatospora sp. NPDC088346 TaxID=3364073 RepID=UPI003820D401